VIEEKQMNLQENGAACRGLLFESDFGTSAG